MMMLIVTTWFSVMLLLVLHEFGHIICAKLMAIKVVKVGFSFIPMPHPYVMVEAVSENSKRVVFLLGGIAMTFVLLLIAAFFELLVVHDFLLYAFSIEILIETNPFYSDLIFLAVPIEQHRNLNDLVYRKKRKGMHLFYANTYSFSWKWYLHFFFWVGLIHLLLSKKVLYCL